MLFDVFTDVAFAGNQLAIFPDTSLDDATMQKIAGELNLAESVFLSPGGDGALASLRIFTPRREVAFAGHPTIGTAIALVDHLWWAGPNETAFVLRERVGDVPITVDRGTPTIAWLTTPPVRLEQTFDRTAAARMLGLSAADVRADVPVQIATAGNPFLYVPLADPAAVDRASLDAPVADALAGDAEIVGVFAFALAPQGAYARMFAPMSGIAEDPATGSAAGPLFAYLHAAGALEERAHFVVEQGVKMGRRSVLHARIGWNGGVPAKIEIGGSAIFVGEGKLKL